MSKKRTKTKSDPPIGIEIGTKVRLLVNNYGASEMNEWITSTPRARNSDDVDLAHMVEEMFGKGTEGVVVFRHPNIKSCPDWVYIEVDSVKTPGKKLYVGVTPRAVEEVK